MNGTGEVRSSEDRSSLFLLAVASAEAAVTSAWQSTDDYVPSDFSAYFPDGPAGGEGLTQLEKNGQLLFVSKRESLAPGQKLAVPVDTED